MLCKLTEQFHRRVPERSRCRVGYTPKRGENAARAALIDQRPDRLPRMPKRAKNCLVTGPGPWPKRRTAYLGGASPVLQVRG